MSLSSMSGILIGGLLALPVEECMVYVTFGGKAGTRVLADGGGVVGWGEYPLLAA